MQPVQSFQSFDDWVTVSDRHGNNITIQRSTAIMIEESRAALQLLVEQISMQREAIIQQNKDVETLNENTARKNRMTCQGSIEHFRKVIQCICSVAVFVFFCSQVVYVLRRPT